MHWTLVSVDRYDFWVTVHIDASQAVFGVGKVEYGPPFWGMFFRNSPNRVNSWFPQSPGTVGYGPHSWKQVWNFYSRVATPGITWTALPKQGPLPGPLLPSRPSLPPTFYPQPVCYFLNVVSLGRLWLGLKTGSLIVHLVKHSRLPVYKLNMHTYNLYNMVGHTPCYIWKHSCL